MMNFFFVFFLSLTSTLPTFVECALTASFAGDTATLSGTMSLSSSTVGTALGSQIFSGSLSGGWNWVKDVNVSVSWTGLSWTYTGSQYGSYVQTVFENVYPALSGSNWGTCAGGMCWCQSGTYYGSEKLIALGGGEKYYKYNVITTASPWTLELTITSPDSTTTVSLSESTTSFFGGNGINVSASAAMSTDCYKDISSSYSMIAPHDPANYTNNYFLNNVYLADQVNRIGLTATTWASSFSCNNFQGYLTIIPQAYTGFEDYYFAWGGVANFRPDQMYAWKAGIYPRTLVYAVAASNPNNCEVLSHSLTGNGNETQVKTLYGTNPGTLSLNIQLPVAMFLNFSTKSPTKGPSSRPSLSPSQSPSSSPTKTPTTGPTTSPSSSPSLSPSQSPSTSPSQTPTTGPTTATPSMSPSGSPVKGPSTSPSTSPTKNPITPSPSASPTTASPTTSPVTSPPTDNPTSNPSRSPSLPRPTWSPTPSFTSEIYGSLFISGVTVTDILANYITVIETTIANALNISVARVVIDMVAVSSRRRLANRQLLSGTVQVDFTVKGYTNTIETLRTELQMSSVSNSIIVSLTNSIPGAQVFEAGPITDTCPAGEILFNNGLKATCATVCDVDEVWNTSTSSCSTPPAVTYTPTSQASATTNYLARALYALLGAFAWGFILMVINICKHMSRR